MLSVKLGRRAAASDTLGNAGLISLVFTEA